jgi:hypothetical protein
MGFADEAAVVTAGAESHRRRCFKTAKVLISLKHGGWKRVLPCPERRGGIFLAGNTRHDWITRRRSSRSFLFIGIGIALYFIPTLVAYMREHRQTLAIFVLNLLLAGLLGLGRHPDLICHKPWRAMVGYYTCYGLEVA